MSFGFSGVLTMNKAAVPGPGIGWHIKNRVRPAFWFGWLVNLLAILFSRVTGVVTMTAELRLRKFLADGGMVDYGVVGYRMVTNAGVAFMAADFFDGTKDISTLNFHGVGTGTAAEAVTDTALANNTTPGGQYVAGTKSNPSSNQYLTAAPITFTAAGNITEHGLFNQASPTGAVLWDRTVFAAVGVQAQDSITYQYNLTINAGG